MHRKSKQAISRIAPLQPPYKPDVAEVLQAFGPPLDLFRLFVRRPARARGILGWGRYCLSRDLALTLRDRELVILRTTALLGHSTNGVFTWRRTRTRQSSTTARSGR